MNQRLLLVVIGVALALGFASCGDAVPQPTPSPTASPEGELPPAWVQKEVAWQSLAAGDAHPQGCSWTVTRAPCLAFLALFLRSYADRSTNAVYFVVLRGHFHAVETPGKSGDRMYLVLQKRGYYYLAHGLLPGQIAVKQLPRMRSYRPVVPVSASIWGHTLGEGGPAPGGPYPARNTPVTVCAGREVSGSPLASVRSDTDGFFSLNLEPGTYTLIMTGKPYTATTVTVRGEGPPLAVGVVLQMM